MRDKVTRQGPQTTTLFFSKSVFKYCREGGFLDTVIALFYFAQNIHRGLFNIDRGLFNNKVYSYTVLINSANNKYSKRESDILMLVLPINKNTIA